MSNGLSSCAAATAGNYGKSRREPSRITARTTLSNSANPIPGWSSTKGLLVLHSLLVSEPGAILQKLPRRRAGRGSAVDALVVAIAEPGGTVLTSDFEDLEALAEHASRVKIERV